MIVLCTHRPCVMCVDARRYGCTAEMLAYTTHEQRYLGSNPRAWLEGGLHHKSNLFPVRRHTSLLHFPPNQQACTNRSFVCQTLAWLREPACSGVGLTIDITVLPELSVCFLHGSLSLSPSILELTVRLVARLISHSLRGMFGLWSAKQTRAFKSTRRSY